MLLLDTPATSTGETPASTQATSMLPPSLIPRNVVTPINQLSHPPLTATIPPSPKITGAKTIRPIKQPVKPFAHAICCMQKEESHPEIFLNGSPKPRWTCLSMWDILSQVPLTMASYQDRYRLNIMGRMPVSKHKLKERVEKYLIQIEGNEDKCRYLILRRKLKDIMRELRVKMEVDQPCHHPQKDVGKEPKKDLEIFPIRPKYHTHTQDPVGSVGSTADKETISNKAFSRSFLIDDPILPDWNPRNPLMINGHVYNASAQQVYVEIEVLQTYFLSTTFVDCPKPGSSASGHLQQNKSGLPATVCGLEVQYCEFEFRV
ncbi:hypothetical protein LXL04_020773 [Taraxacum kok-saghyz]